MSHRRKTHDGDYTGRDSDTTKRRDSLNHEDEINQYVVSQRTRRNFSRIVEENEEESGEKDRYLLTYADLITLLLGLFIILYAMSNVDSEKYAQMQIALGNLFGVENQLKEIPKGKFIITKENIIPVRNTKDIVQSIIDSSKLSKNFNLKENKRGVTISILDDILFSSGTADLQKQSKEVLKVVGKLIRKLPNDVRIEGHTDNIPIKSKQFPSNWHLSVARANNTAYYLMQYEKIDPSKVSIVGYSSYRPVADNSTPEGRAFNRRVDIVILKK